MEKKLSERAVKQSIIRSTLFLLASSLAVPLAFAASAWDPLGPIYRNILPTYSGSTAMAIDAILLFFLVAMPIVTAAKRIKAIPNTTGWALGFGFWLPLVIWQRNTGVLLFGSVWTTSIAYLIASLATGAVLHGYFSSIVKQFKGSSGRRTLVVSYLLAMGALGIIFIDVIRQATATTPQELAVQGFMISFGSIAAPLALLISLISIPFVWGASAVSAGAASFGVGGAAKAGMGGLLMGSIAAGKLAQWVKKNAPVMYQHRQQRGEHLAFLQDFEKQLAELLEQESRNNQKTLEGLKAYLVKLEGQLDLVVARVEQYRNWMHENNQSLPDTYKAAFEAQSAQWDAVFESLKQQLITHHVSIPLHSDELIADADQQFQEVDVLHQYTLKLEGVYKEAVHELSAFNIALKQVQPGSFVHDQFQRVGESHSVQQLMAFVGLEQQRLLQETDQTKPKVTKRLADQARKIVHDYGALHTAPDEPDKEFVALVDRLQQQLHVALNEVEPVHARGALRTLDSIKHFVETQQYDSIGNNHEVSELLREIEYYWNMQTTINGQAMDLNKLIQEVDGLVVLRAIVAGWAALIRAGNAPNAAEWTVTRQSLLKELPQIKVQDEHAKQMIVYFTHMVEQLAATKPQDAGPDITPFKQLQPPVVGTTVTRFAA